MPPNDKRDHTQASVAQKQFEVSMVERLSPIAPPACFFVNKNSEGEWDAKENREKRRRRVSYNKGVTKLGSLS